MSNEIDVKLQELRKQALTAMEEYNKLAKKQKVGSRLAMMTGEYCGENEDDEVPDDDKISAYEGNVYVSVEVSDDSYNWFPSSICIGF